MTTSDTASRATTVVVADDHALSREGLVLILNRQPGIEVIGEAGNRATAAAVTVDRHPDVLLLGLELADQDLESAIHKVKLRSPGTKIVVLSHHDDPILVRGALGSGANGYVTRNLTGAELITAILAIQRDDEHAVLSISRDSLARYADGTASPLTPRETEILRLAAEAMTNSQIAMKLSIAAGTVKRHLSNAYTRLGAESRIDAINKAVALGIVRKPPSL
jgi:DNA-binding NarL/FixJ family response regulator